MSQIPKRSLLYLLLACVAALALWITRSDLYQKDRRVKEIPEHGTTLKLYWFVPDGFRADPDTFNIYEWARAGELPNIARMLKAGTYGYSVPVFPGHTPTNFATLFTGAAPEVHGVADGPMHMEGYPLQVVSKSGFSSIAKKIPPIWFTLERLGYNVTLLSVPGSTPPELSRGTTIRGRWGGWGLDFPAVNFHSDIDTRLRVLQGHANRVFEFGPALTRYVSARHPAGWEMPLPASFSPPREVELTNWSSTVYAYIYDSTDDGTENYDAVLFSKDKQREWTKLGIGEWSGWLGISLSYQTANDYNIYSPKKMEWERQLSTISVDTEVKIKIIKLGARDFFRIRFLYNALNRYSAKPPHVVDTLTREAGPMVDFVDNFPPQLVYYDEDKETFFEEARMSLEWHRRAAAHLVKNGHGDIIIHDIYTPNQMLTSRWWLGYLDPKSPRYGEISERQRARLWGEVKAMYKGIDAIIGEVLDRADRDTIIVLSSDHGVVPLHTEVKLNNLFASRGLLRFTYDEHTGGYAIDWTHTRAVFLKMDGIYINPGGLGGNYRRASGAEYEQLRKEVIEILRELRDANGNAPVSRITRWEDAGRIGLPLDRVGDLIVANRAGYGFVEELTREGEIFAQSVTSGYKQGVIPDGEPGMLTPFIVIGPGVKPGNQLKEPISHVDQYPTIMTLLGAKVPDFVQGKPVVAVRK